MEELNWKYSYTYVEKDHIQSKYEECTLIRQVDAK